MSRTASHATAAVVTLALCTLGGACRTPHIEGAADDGALHQTLERPPLQPGAPPDCDDAIFARTFHTCPAPAAAFPRIWDALAPSLTPERARGFVAAEGPALDACCGAADLVVELDLVVACDGRVEDAAASVGGAGAPLLAGACLEGVARGWTLDRPNGHEQGVHVLVPCGTPGARR